MLVFRVLGTMSVFQVPGTMSVLQVLARMLVFQFLVRVTVFQALLIVLLPKCYRQLQLSAQEQKFPSVMITEIPSAIGLSDRSVRRIVHKDLNFYLYEIASIQELCDRDMANCRISSEELLEMLIDDGVFNTVLMTD